MVGVDAFAVEAVGFHQLYSFAVLGVVDVDEDENGAALGELDGQLPTQSFARARDEHDLVAHVLLGRRENKIEHGPKDALVELPYEKQELNEKRDTRPNNGHFFYSLILFFFLSKTILFVFLI